MTPEYKRSKVGFPIRKSLDQSSFAAPQGLSQRTTSFIASQRQGIHRMLLRHLITLMIDARPLGRERTRPKRKTSPADFSRRTFCLPNTPDPTACGAVGADPKKPARSNVFPLYDFKHPRAAPFDRKQTRTSMTPDNTNKTTHRKKNASVALKKMVEPDGIEPTTS